MVWKATLAQMSAKFSLQFRPSKGLRRNIHVKVCLLGIHGRLSVMFLVECLM